jgi:mono/diheme cytochrome c family protein
MVDGRSAPVRAGGPGQSPEVRRARVRPASRILNARCLRVEAGGIGVGMGNVMRRLRGFRSAVAVIAVVAGVCAALDSRAGLQAAEGQPIALAVAHSPTRSPLFQQAPNSATASAPSADVFRRYCVGCHNDRMKGNYGNLSLEGVDPAVVGDHAETLEKVVRKIRKGLMPPPGRPRPDAATFEAFVSSVENALDRAAEKEPNPGRVISRRLNRVEYVNAIYDLLGLEVNGSELLPSDMAGFGFDNNADVLSITPGLMSRYITAATKISRVAMATAENRPATNIYKVEIGTRQDARMSEDMSFATFGGLAVKHTFPLDGEYAFQIRLTRDQDGLINGITAEHEIELRVDRQLVKRFKIGGEYREPDPGQLIAVPEDDELGKKVHEYYINADNALTVRVPMKAGTRVVTAAFVEAEPIPEARSGAAGGGAQGSIFGQGSGFDSMSIAGPFNPSKAADTPARRRILTCKPTSARQEEPCARQILTRLTRRAYRGLTTPADVDELLAIYKKGRPRRDFDTGLARALEALLASPKFVLRIEQDRPAGDGAAYRLSDLEFASRLSFFLWKSIPDDELLQVAERRQLSDRQVLLQQVRRMLADERSQRFLDDFSGQWLEVRNISTQQPAQQFQFDSTLRDAMARETELFFESQVREDRPIQDLLRANYTFLNERLAQHYGIPGVFGSHMRRVTLTDENRFGLLGQGSVLTITSYNDRTSVVRRGYWILDVLLGAPPPPPPPNVPPLKENDSRGKPAALRERMEQHRNNAICASCHSQMDPLGFALEHYDAVGKYRETDGGARIDSDIEYHGKMVGSPKEFREALLGQGGEFVRTVVEKMLTYALGRGLSYHDAPVVRQLVRALRENEYRWSTLLTGIVESAQFQMRSVPQPATATASRELTRRDATRGGQ